MHIPVLTKFNDIEKEYNIRLQQYFHPGVDRLIVEYVHPLREFCSQLRFFEELKTAIDVNNPLNILIKYINMCEEQIGTTPELEVEAITNVLCYIIYGPQIILNDSIAEMIYDLLCLFMRPDCTDKMYSIGIEGVYKLFGEKGVYPSPTLFNKFHNRERDEKMYILKHRWRKQRTYGGTRYV